MSIGIGQGPHPLLRRGKMIRNVNNSTNDPQFFRISSSPYYSNSWIDLWSKQTHGSSRCCICGTWSSIKGGHILLGKSADQGAAVNNKDSLKGTNRVFIAPLCEVCNGNRTNNAMQVQFDTPILNLIGYMLDEYPHARVDQLAVSGADDEQINAVIEAYEKKKDQIKQAQRNMNACDANYLSASTRSARTQNSEVSDPSYVPGTSLKSTWIK